MQLIEKNKLIMQQFIGEVEPNDEGVSQVCTGMNYAPIINFEDGTKVIFDWEEIINMAVEFKNKQK